MSKNVFKECQKLVVSWPVSRNSLGREFRSLRPSTENAQRPHEFRRYDGTTRWWPAAERRWHTRRPEHNRCTM